MSTQDPHGGPPLRQEPEEFNGPRVVLVAVVTLVIFAVGMVWATQIWISRSKDMAPNGSSSAAELGKREIGIVDQVPFDQMNDPAEQRARQHKRLTTYGWIDRKAGLVHVPIERGYELAIQEQRGAKP